MNAPIDAGRSGLLTTLSKASYVFDPVASVFHFDAHGFAPALQNVMPDDVLRVCAEISARRMTNGTSVADPSPIVFDPTGRPSGLLSDARIGVLFAVASTHAIDSLQPQELYVLMAELNALRALDPRVSTACPSCSYQFSVPVNQFTLSTSAPNA